MLSIIAATALSATSPFVATLDDVDAKHQQPSWERWSFTLTNTSESEQDLRICPKDVDRIAHDPARTTKHAFALSFGDDDWNRGCVETSVAAGASVTLNAYTRPYGTPGTKRTVVLRSNDGLTIPTAG